MRRRFLILLLISSATVNAAVTTTEYYDDRQCAVLWTSDDMYDYWKNSVTVYSNRWWGYVNAAELCLDNNMVFNPGLNPNLTNWVRSVGYRYDDSWDWLNAKTDISSFIAANHGATHPVNILNYEEQYLTSRENLFDKLEYPWQMTYKGAEFMPSFIQWGGATNMDYGDYLNTYGSFSTTGLARTVTMAGNYLTIRGIHDDASYDATYGARGEWPTWNEDWQMYDDIEPTHKESLLLAGDNSAFDTAYANGRFYMLYNHAWQTFSDPSGPNAAIWEAWAAYVGNRKDVWYTDLSSLITYHYLQDQAPPIITETNTPSYWKMTVTGDATDRAKYGLSYPLTYRIDKPAAWDAAAEYRVYYRDTGLWSEMTEKTTNDYFTGINCYRDDGTNVLVSQGLPQWSDRFEIKLRRIDRRPLPMFFSSGGN